MSKRYDFRRKTYGYGWTPVTTRGWLITFGFIFVLIAFAYIVLGTGGDDPSLARLAVYGVGLAVLVALFAWFTRKIAPPARWQWGKRNNNQENRK